MTASIRSIAPRLLLSALLTTTFAVAAACADDPAVPPVSDTGEAVQAIHGERLAQLRVDDSLEVGFYELAPGVVAVRESGDLDAVPAGEPPPSALAGLDPASATLAEVYRAVTPGSEVPAAILAADARAQLSSQRAASLSPSGAPSAPDQGQTYVASERGVRSPDYNGNGYDWQWFLDNFCVEGGFRFCPTNTTWAYSGLESTSWFKTCTFAADWESGVQFKGAHWVYFEGVWPWFSGEWVTFVDWDYVVQPRRWECWWYSGSGYRESWATGLAPAPRVHFSALRNH